MTRIRNTVIVTVCITGMAAMLAMGEGFPAFIGRSWIMALLYTTGVVVFVAISMTLLIGSYLYLLTKFVLPSPDYSPTYQQTRIDQYQ